MAQAEKDVLREEAATKAEAAGGAATPSERKKKKAMIIVDDEVDGKTDEEVGDDASLPSDVRRILVEATKARKKAAVSGDSTAEEPKDSTEAAAQRARVMLEGLLQKAEGLESAFD